MLSSPAEIIVNQIIVNQATSCATADGSVFINASGGEGVLNYSMNNGGQWQENPQFDHLACGDLYLINQGRGKLYSCLAKQSDYD